MRQLASTYTVPDRDQDALNTVTDRFPTSASARTSLEQQWAYSLAFLRGDQYVNWNSDAGGLVRRPISTNRNRIRDMRNFIRPTCERRLATLVNRLPRFKTRPNSTDIEDIQSARTGEKIAQAYWRSTKMNTKRQTLAYWMLVTGNGFLKVYWDPKGGKRELGPEIQELGQGIDGEMQYAPVPETERLYYQGDIVCEVISPFDMVVDPMARDFEDLEWIGQQCVRHISWVERRWPELSGHVDTQSRNEMTRGESLSLFGISGLDSETSVYTRDEWVTVREYWEQPSEIYPRGRYIIEAGGVILRNKGNPTPDGDLPYIHYKDLLVPNSFWGQAVIENLLVPQRNFNRLNSRRLENTYLFSHLKVLFNSQTNVAEPRWTNRIGDIVHYTGQTPPQYMAPPPLPPEAGNLMNEIKQDFDTISSTYGPERGQYTGKLSGKAIDLLQEAGQTVKIPAVIRHTESDERWATLVLKHFQEYADEERTIKVIGKANSWDVEAFKGSDLGGNTDIYVELDSVIPKSRTMVIAELTAMAQIGLFNPQDPEDRSRAMKSLDQEDAETIVYEKNLHLRRAQLEDKAMLAGVQVPPPEWDESHDDHMAQHRATRQTDEYRGKPPEIKALFELHLLQHGQMAMPMIGATLSPQQEEAAYAEEESNSSSAS